MSNSAIWQGYYSEGTGEVLGLKQSELNKHFIKYRSTAEYKKWGCCLLLNTLVFTNMKAT